MKVRKKPLNIKPPTNNSTNSAAEVVEPAKKAEPAKAEPAKKEEQPAPASAVKEPSQPIPSSQPAPVNQPSEQPKQAASTNKQQTNQPAASQIVIPKGNSVNQSKSGNSLAPKK